MMVYIIFLVVYGLISLSWLHPFIKEKFKDVPRWIKILNQIWLIVPAMFVTALICAFI